MFNCETAREKWLIAPVKKKLSVVKVTSKKIYANWKLYFLVGFEPNFSMSKHLDTDKLHATMHFP